MRLLSFTLLVATAHRAAAQILGDFPAQAELPAVVQENIVVDGETQFLNTTETAATVANLNLNNIQGDILVVMKKLKEYFVFFHINNGPSFKSKLQGDLGDAITTTAQVLDPNFSPPALLNVAFSFTGLRALGVSEADAAVGDQDFFKPGQFADGPALGDDLNQWVNAFKGTSIHGVFIIASDSWDHISTRKGELDVALGSDWTIMHTVLGETRPGDQAGHEHFGYMDGISQPGINQFTTTPMPGQAMINAGVILCGHEDDTSANQRPAWATDGSFLAFRQLKQLVPEFKKFLVDNALTGNGRSVTQGAELLGARMIGRWPSGAPLELSPNNDDPVLGADPLRNNNFDFTFPGSDINSDQSRCPFSAHIRKVKPRGDFLRFGGLNTANQIMRAGIPYGPEVTATEANSHTSSTAPSLERGLAFVSYQSIIPQGFHFQQVTWANNIGFIFGKNDTTPGFDVIIGQSTTGPRFASGLDPEDFNRDISFPVQHVISRGGEYFFSPPISALKSGFV